MKIAIDLTALAFNFSGIERYALNVARRLVLMDMQDEFELLFCNTVYSDFQKVVEQNNCIHIHIVTANSNKMNKLFLFQYKILKEMNGIKADCYFFPAFAPPILFHKKNMVSVIHDLGYFDCPKMWKWYVTAYGKTKIRAAVRHCGRMLTVSNEGRNRLMERFSVMPERVTVAYNAVEDRFKSEQLDANKKQRIIDKYGLQEDGYLLCLATLEPRKNLKLLVRAYTELYQQGKIATRLVLAGRKGWKIDDLLKEAGEAANNITVTGFVDDEDLPAVYQMAKLFVFPSVYEGFGIPPLEALACGTPVLVSDISVFKEIYGENATYFQSNNLEDLKMHLLDTATYEKRIDKKIFGCFDWQRTADIVYLVLSKSANKI